MLFILVQRNPAQVMIVAVDSLNHSKRSRYRRYCVAREIKGRVSLFLIFPQCIVVVFCTAADRGRRKCTYMLVTPDLCKKW
ncbi:hypothetical protein F5141DRAFT_1127940, partial [Pisolithus sp. B1]